MIKYNASLITCMFFEVNFTTTTSKMDQNQKIWKPFCENIISVVYVKINYFDYVFPWEAFGNKIVIMR